MSEVKPFCYLNQTHSYRDPPHGWSVHFIDGDIPLYTADALAAARDAALEEAALFLEQNEHALCAGEFAPAIRALKERRDE